MEILAFIPLALFVYAIVGIISTPFGLWKTNLCSDLLDFSSHSKRGFFTVESWRDNNGLEVEDIHQFFHPFLRPWNAVFVRRNALIPNDEIGREFIQYMKGKAARKKAKKDRQREVVKNSSWQKKI